MAKRYIASLDIGSSKNCVVAASIKAGKAEVMGFGLSQSAGIKKGTVVDMEAASTAISQAVKAAQASSGLRIDSLYVGVSAEHIKCDSSYGATGIKGKSVTQRDIDKAIETASAFYVPVDREMLHVLPADYVIDGQHGIVRPHGMSGVRLEANVRVVTGSQAALENLMKAVQLAGCGVSAMVFEPVSSQRAVLTREEAETGAVLIDIGAGVSTATVFRECVLRQSFVLALGGGNITNDIAIGLKVSVAEAERLKKESQFILYPNGSGQQVRMFSMDGSARLINQSAISDIARPRCEEILTMLKNGIANSELYSAPACVVITGGTALINGIEKSAEAVFGLPSRVGVPEAAFSESVADAGALISPAYSASLGLALYGLEHISDSYDELIDGSVGRFKGWMKGLFSVRRWGLNSIR